MVGKNSKVETLIKKSKKRIKNYFENKFEYTQLPVPRSNEFLRRHISEQMPLFVLYVDLIGSTKMSSKLTPDILSFILRSFCQEMAYIIEDHGGYVLKFVGDAAIGYFQAGENPRLVAEKTSNCGKSMIKVIENAINPILKEEVYPKLGVRVTVDFGICTVVIYSADKTKAHVDIIGLPLNLAAKMQSVAKPNQIIIGKQVYDRLNSKLRTDFKKINTDSKKWYPEFNNKSPYPVYGSIKSKLNSK